MNLETLYADVYFCGTPGPGELHVGFGFGRNHNPCQPSSFSTHSTLLTFLPNYSPTNLCSLAMRGFTILHLSLQASRFADPLPRLPHVPLRALHNDVRDADQLLNRTLHCPPPQVRKDKIYLFDLSFCSHLID